MRARVPLILAALGVVLGLAAAAEAGRYHQGATLECAGCHIMHASQQHATGGGVSGFPLTVNGGAGVANLLRAAGTNALCLTCHDGQTSAPDVLTTDTNATGLGGRSAGALNQSSNTTAPYENWKGHSLGSTATAPGGTFANTNGLACADCHNQHGSTSYRNLNTSVSDLLSTTSANTANVRIAIASYTGAANNSAATREPYYATNNIFHHEPSANLNGYTTFCVSCHTSFTSSSTTKHPSLNTIDVGGTDNTNYNVTSWSTLAKVKVTANDYSPATGPTEASPFCGTCHKAHGNDNAFGLLYMNRAGLIGTVTEQGTPSGTETNLCSQCHTQAN